MKSKILVAHNQLCNSKLMLYRTVFEIENFYSRWMLLFYSWCPRESFSSTEMPGAEVCPCNVRNYFDKYNYKESRLETALKKKTRGNVDSWGDSWKMLLKCPWGTCSSDTGVYRRTAPRRCCSISAYHILISCISDSLLISSRDKERR